METPNSVDIKNRMPRNYLKRGGRLTLKIVRLFFLVSILWVLFYKFVNPPITYLMLNRYFESSTSIEKSIRYHWVPSTLISNAFKLAVISSEDQNFFQHFGFDLEAIKLAWTKNKKSKRIKGGSTISQQTAKNVFLWPNRSWTRKILESYFTLLIEVFWSKERILEVYMNVIEMGKGIYGVEAASSCYFKTPCKKLTKNQAALIVACFPNPRRWNPQKPTSYILKRKNWILKNMGFKPLQGILLDI